MTLLAWDTTGERRYETGVDRGVLYHPDGYVVPWNGLISVAEKTGSSTNSYYYDGRKYLTQQVLDSYSATLRAFTYPDALDELLGVISDVPGSRMHEQKSRRFSLSYRTKVGNDLNADLGYKIHVVYNVLASPSNTEMETVSDTPDATTFEWDLDATPVHLTGASIYENRRPPSHLSFNSRQLSPSALAAVEAAIYDDALELPSWDSLLLLARSS